VSRRIGIYARLSQDRDGQQTATARQIADARALAELRGWTVAEVYEDVDLSAYKAVTRPAYERLLGDLEARRVDGVIVWKLDRLVRRAREFERFWQVCEGAGASLISVNEPIDTSTELGLVIVRVLMAFAELEAATMSVRIKSKAAELARNGHANRGGTRPFGLTADWSALVPEEADLIREAADRVLSGESVRGLCADWSARGVTTPTGGPWQPSPLRRLLTQSRLAGLREHRGANPVAGTWPAIIDRDTLERLRAVLRDPHRRTTNGSPRRYLLAGLLRCSECGRRLVARPRGDKVRRYVCASGPAFGGCGKLAILAEPLEELVSEMALEALDSPALEAELRRRNERQAPASDVEQLRRDEEALEQLARDHYVDAIIGRREYLAAREALEGRITQGRRRIASETATRTLDGLTGSARALWPTLSFDRRRAVLQSVLEDVTVRPGRRGFNRFDPLRVAPTWAV
jgi:site-specific DNA recombinase